MSLGGFSLGGRPLALRARDRYAQAEIKPALARLLGILIGVAVLKPVLLGWHLVARSRRNESGRSCTPSDPNGHQRRSAR